MKLFMIRSVAVNIEEQPLSFKTGMPPRPRVVRSCRSALETLSGVQTEFLQKMADEVEDSKDELADSEYIFSDFLDRYGPRMAHLNGVLQVLNHLSG